MSEDNKNQPEKQWRLQIERLVFGGEGLGYYGGRPVFVAGVLLNEEVLVHPVIVKRKFVKAELIEVIRPSRLRRESKEQHFISCSPWQIMTEENQLDYKKNLVKSVFKKIGQEILPDDLELVASPNNWGYRNKIEFSFTTDKDNLPTLAFNKRYLYNDFIKTDGCLLAPEILNNCAQEILKVLRENKEVKVGDLKNLTLRYSFADNKCLAILYVKTSNFPKISVTASHLAGWLVVYSDPRSPSAVITEELLVEGDDFLSEQIDGQKLFYCYQDFFQINPPAFSDVIKELKKVLTAGEVLIDLYSGVGTIGFCLSDKFKKIYSAEIAGSSRVAAEKNINSLGLKDKVEFLSIPADNFSFTDLKLNNDATVIVDPPRSGLEGKILKNILEFSPKILVYLSCNPATQARDWLALKDNYRIISHKLFDFYPQTPHVESLMVLERK
jgi:23S rRNA (uracil1939-C5)-methyltransferase